MLLMCNDMVRSNPDGNSIDAFAMPDKSALTVTLPTDVLAFWVFAGLENLTLLSREFRDPQRDFLPVSVIALGLYVILIVLLTAGIAVQISSDEVDPVAGLIQLAREIHPPGLAVTVVATIGVARADPNGAQKALLVGTDEGQARKGLPADGRGAERGLEAMSAIWWQMKSFHLHVCGFACADRVT